MALNGQYLPFATVSFHALRLAGRVSAWVECSKSNSAATLRASWLGLL
ncbi:MAG: hypothetical protein ACXWIZ_05065 [Caldimonas sp.]